jgi:Phytanoyl-CoA dioxygenase (PhyH)
VEVTAATDRAQVPYFGGPWFMSPFFEQEIAERGLDAEAEAQVRAFAQRGYLVVDDLGLDDFDALADRVTADADRLHEGGKFNRIMDAWTVSDAIRAVATPPRIIELLELLYGRRPIPFQTLNFLRGSEQPTHSDSYHFHSYPKHFMCGVWIAFEDIGDDNGPLHYYPGSHRLPDYDFLCPHREEEMRDFVQELIPAYGLERERAYLKRGQALIWSANLLHGGDPVADRGSTRRSQVTHYYFADCTYYTPFRSDFARGRVYFRQIIDVGTGKLQPLRRDGGRVRPPFLSRLVTLRRAVERRLGRGYVQYPA